ncbi:MAG: YceI family protein [Bacteroidetes bacterium]|nr:YceI family protein [Bacteroidota bacterium]
MKYILLVTSMLTVLSVRAQPVYMSKSGTISFFAGTAVEDIDATNEKALSFFNTETGEVVISIPNKEFHFRRSLMEEHFNENYMETGKYPKSEFKGKVNDIKSINFAGAGPFQLSVTGQLNIHGVSKERTIDVTLRKDGNRFISEAKFKVLLEDHKIDRPKILWEKIAESVEVNTNLVYEPYKK